MLNLKKSVPLRYHTHLWFDTQDNAKYEPFMKKAKKNTLCTLHRPRKLKDLDLTKLGREIQKVGEVGKCDA